MSQPAPLVVSPGLTVDANGTEEGSVGDARTNGPKATLVDSSLQSCNVFRHGIDITGT